VGIKQGLKKQNVGVGVGKKAWAQVTTAMLSGLGGVDQMVKDGAGGKIRGNGKRNRGEQVGTPIKKKNTKVKGPKKRGGKRGQNSGECKKKG